MTHPSQEFMERWAAGDWGKEPDGGTCCAIREAWNAGHRMGMAELGIEKLNRKEEVERLTKDVKRLTMILRDLCMGHPDTCACRGCREVFTAKEVKPL